MPAKEKQAAPCVCEFAGPGGETGGSERAESVVAFGKEGK